ncbi:sugar kinase [Phenylobacterium montanum]|uniref:Sugar kinase n=1 Tax=Phenylobacterium montanum TaxID=2823693 RepID=A0A975FYC4_9CAUL|nr:sugar kinase [Caulobacter sp. S6]QUD87234.1 sugar kinase [Caulobacter sp. S6]
MTRAVSIGECMVELREEGPSLYRRAFAGDAYNTAVYLKRSARDLDVQFLTATGDGRLSREMRQAWAAEGIGDELAFRVRGAEPGLYMIELDPHGDRSFHYWRSASAARGWLRELVKAGGADKLAGAALVHLSAISLAILSDDDRAEAVALIAALKGRVGRISFDTNIRPALWRDMFAARMAVEPVLRAADVVRASRDDAKALFGEDNPKRQVEALRGAGARELVLTLDAAGCILAADRAETVLPAPATMVKDTSGAGDSFNGAYLAARLAGQSPLDAAHAGLNLAARVVTWPGAVVPVEVSHPE